jgi:FAD/FMN-containing dehydrogenase
MWVNDIHSQLNWTRVREILTPGSINDLQWAVRLAREKGLRLSCAGGRHAMGGQQFGAGNLHLDLGGFNEPLQFDHARGIVEVEAGMQWPRLIEWLNAAQADSPESWGIRQKQTGADRLSLGGALSANIHGRGLTLPPFVNDIESFTIVTPEGEVRECSRTENADLFRLAIGGYGLFGLVYSIRLRLARRRRLRRVVKLTTTDALAAEFEQRIKAGFLYGDFQFAIDSRSRDFMRKGVFSCYEPVAFDLAGDEDARQLTPEDWRDLLRLAHTAPTEAFERYARYYLATDGQLYWSGTHQLGYYCDNYHHDIDEACRCLESGSEMITELYVPKILIASFMDAARRTVLQLGARVIYGTIRLIEPESETLLRWAREPSACVIFNLHTDHNPAALVKFEHAFRALIDVALSFGGSFYLTYHRYATRAQLLKAYPEFPQFLFEKQKRDPESILESTWYRHLRNQFESVDNR